MKVYFSESKFGFFFDSLVDLYKESGTLPNDLVAISTREYEVYQAPPPKGMKLGVVKGRPVWEPCTADKGQGKV